MDNIISELSNEITYEKVHTAVTYDDMEMETGSRYMFVVRRPFNILNLGCDTTAGHLDLSLG